MTFDLRSRKVDENHPGNLTYHPTKKVNPAIGFGGVCGHTDRQTDTHTHTHIQTAIAYYNIDSKMYFHPAIELRLCIYFVLVLCSC